MNLAFIRTRSTQGVKALPISVESPYCKWLAQFFYCGASEAIIREVKIGFEVHFKIVNSSFQHEESPLN